MKDKKKKTDYRFSRVKPEKRSNQNQPRQAVDSNGQLFPTESYRSRNGDKDWVTFVGADTVHQVPSSAAVIVVNGNGKTYRPELYARFHEVLFVSITSSFNDEWINPSATQDDANNILAFAERNVEYPIAVQCSAGEQRSAAVAAFLEYETDRSIDLEAPGCNGTLSFMDATVLRALRKTLRMEVEPQ